MSSQIPTKRVTRATRLQDENAVRGRQPAARTVANPGSSMAAAAAAAAAAGSSKPRGNATADSTAAQHKRKREALGEVTNNNKNKNMPRGALKDGKPSRPAVTKPAPAPRPVGSTVRQTRASASAREARVPDVPVEEQNVDAMAVDQPAEVRPLQRVSRRLSTRTLTGAGAAAAVTAAATRGGTLAKRVGAAAALHHERAVLGEVEQPTDDADLRAAKRRRTSSEVGDEDGVEAEVEVDALPPDELHTRPAELGSDVEEEGEEITGWDDLDKDDFDDPMMVSEYVVDIFKYLSECEDLTLPNPNYIQHQAELRWSQRAVLMDFLIGLHQQFRLCQETLYLAVNLIDRFLSMRVVSLAKLQLVGLAGLFVAAKFEEIVAPSAQHYLKAAAIDGEVKQEDILKAERYILKTLDYTVSLYPQPMNWLRRVSKADDYDPQVRTVAKYFLEIHVVERKLLGVKPSLLAAASMWLSRLVLNHTVWTPNLVHYSGYTEKKIIPVANIILNYCLRTEKHEYLQQKFASRKFSKASVFVNDWVTARWTLGEKVMLANELPFIKALAEGAEEGLP